MDKFEAMRVFCNVIEAGSFVAAAERMGQSTTAVSRLVAQLEAHLNVRLLNRTTRRMHPTHKGLLISSAVPSCWPTSRKPKPACPAKHGNRAVACA